MDRIARRAHEIFERRGGSHGQDIAHWLQAEREIDAEIDAEQERAQRERSQTTP
jgi:hypothetical protein